MSTFETASELLLFQNLPGLFLSCTSQLSHGIKDSDVCSVCVDGGAAALLDALYPLFPRVGRQSRAEQSVGDSAEGFGSTGGAGLEGAAVLVNVSRDEEGVALSVAEAVDDGPAQAALLVDRLLQRLRFAPVHAQVPTLCDVQRLLAGLEHFFRGRGDSSGRA